MRNNPDVSPKISEIRVAYLKQGAQAFSKGYLIAKDRYGLGGNVTSYHYSLSTLPGGTVWSLYSLKRENNQYLYGRIVKAAGLTPQLTLRKGTRKFEFAWISGHRPTMQGGGMQAMITDQSAIGTLTCGRSVYLDPITGTVLFHGTGCAGSRRATPDLYPRQAAGFLSEHRHRTRR